MDPQGIMKCPYCDGTGMVNCVHSCSECVKDGACQEQDSQVFKQYCTNCDGSGEISDGAYADYKSDMRERAAEMRAEEERDGDL